MFYGMLTSYTRCARCRLSITNYKDAQNNVIAAHAQNEHPLTQNPGYATCTYKVSCLPILHSPFTVDNLKVCAKTCTSSTNHISATCILVYTWKYVYSTLAKRERNPRNFYPMKQTNKQQKSRPPGSQP